MSSILPESNSAADVNVERSHNPKLGDFDASIQNMDYIHRYTFFLSAENQDLSKQAKDILKHQVMSKICGIKGEENISNIRDWQIASNQLNINRKP